MKWVVSRDAVCGTDLQTEGADFRDRPNPTKDDGSKLGRLLSRQFQFRAYRNEDQIQQSKIPSCVLVKKRSNIESTETEHLEAKELIVCIQILQVSQVSRYPKQRVVSKSYIIGKTSGSYPWGDFRTLFEGWSPLVGFVLFLNFLAQTTPYRYIKCSAYMCSKHLKCSCWPFWVCKGLCSLFSSGLPSTVCICCLEVRGIYQPVSTYS